MLSSDDPESKLKEETLVEITSEPEEIREQAERRSAVRTLTTTSQSITKIQIPDEELEKLDEKIDEQIERDLDGNFKCKICGKISSGSSKFKVNMKNHIETHFEGLAFPCSICSVVLRSRASFAMHKSKKHRQI